MAPERAGPDPHDLASGAELVHPGGRVGARPPGEDIALPNLDREGEALQRDQDLPQPIHPRPARGMAVDVLPRGQEAGQGLLINRLDLLAQDSQRGPADAPQDLGITPLALAPAPGEIPSSGRSSPRRSSPARSSTARTAEQSTP